VQLEEDWLSAAVVNSHLVCDPTIQQPGFDLRHEADEDAISWLKMMATKALAK